MKTLSSRPAQLVAAALAGTALLTACSSPPPPPRQPGTTVLVVGNRSNMPKPVLVGPARAAVETAVRSKDVLYLVSVSGEPQIAGQQKIEYPCKTKAVCDDAAHTVMAKIDAALTKTVQPAREEADLLSAVSLAADTLRAEKGPKTLVVVDNGLQTTGQLSLVAPDALAIDPEAVASDLVDNHGVSTLEGVDVVMVGLNAAAPPQRALTPSRSDRLRRLWTAVFKDAKAKSVDVEAGGFPQSDPVSGLPTVSVVPKDDPAPKPTPTFTPDKPTCVPLREDQVGFVKNEATFRDPGKARSFLEDLAGQLVASGVSAVLTGTTALPETKTGDARLSYQRALAVRDELVALGVPVDRLQVEGVGTDFPGYVDPAAGGRWNPIVAIRDRLVIVRVNGALCPPAGD